MACRLGRAPAKLKANISKTQVPLDAVALPFLLFLRRDIQSIPSSPSLLPQSPFFWPAPRFTHLSSPPLVHL